MFDQYILLPLINYFNTHQPDMVQDNTLNQANTHHQNQQPRQRRKGILIPSNTDLYSCFIQFAE